MRFLLNDTSNVHVLIVEPAASVRMLITDILRSLGYRNLHSAGSGKDAVKLLEVEEIHWVILPLMATESVNALQILGLILNEPSLNHTATTLLLEPNSEDYCLPLAFEMGLLSWAPKSYIKESLASEFQDLMKCFALNHGNVTLTAADYLRRFLSEKRMHLSRQSLEQNLLSCFPGSAKLLLNMAEAEVLAGNEARAIDLLSQAEIIDERLGPTCKQLRDKYLKNVSNINLSSRENTLGIKTVVVIDPDTDVLFAATEMLQQIGVNSVETFENGLLAFNWIKQCGTEPDLIIMEWRLPGLSGPLLIQRIRQEGFLQVPIIIASSLVKRDEKPLLMEMGVDEVLEKPFDRTTFFSVIIWAIQQNRVPTEQKSLERKFRRLIHAGQNAEAERILAQLFADPRVNEGSKKGLQAEYLFSQADFNSACDLAVQALKLGGDSLSLLNIVGKCLLKLNQFEKALQCFEKANSLCSINIERLLTIAEINIKLDRTEAAERACDAALHLDAANGPALQAKCGIDIESGDLEKAKLGIGMLDSVPRIASYINNRAIALARAGRYEESITLYKRAILCLEPKWPELGTTVAYNLGLAYARYGDYDSALHILKDLAYEPKLGIQRKALALFKKLERTVKSGIRLFQEEPEDHMGNVDEVSETSVKVESDPVKLCLDSLMVKIAAKRGDIGCYLIFNSLDEIADRSKDLIKSTPRFTHRKAIATVKSETLKTGT